jgi:SAM-dependent methyltransferase
MVHRVPVPPLSTLRRLARSGIAAISPATRARLRGALAAADADELLRWELSPVPDRLGTVTDRLFERLPASTMAEVQRRLTAAEQREWSSLDAAGRKRLAIELAVDRDLPGVSAATGLRRFDPPPDVHAMARGPFEARGTYELADMVLEALERVGSPPTAGQTGLDFGCSSGRVVRLLSASHPEVRWYGREPNVNAIAWAAEQLLGVDLRASPVDPPLDLDAASLDFAFAMSIWSHYSESAALRWLAEMRRVIRPGGHLLLTVHGYRALAFFQAWRLRDPHWLLRARAGLNRAGYWFHDDFGAAGDHGIVNPDWGISFMSLEWLCAAVTPDWRVAWFACARAGGNQDLIVLQRAA